MTHLMKGCQMLNTEIKMTKDHTVPTSALFQFIALTLVISWGLAAAYLFLPGPMNAIFGELVGAHPLYFLMTWGPGIAGIVIVLKYGGKSGLRAFMSRLFVWRVSAAWWALVFLVTPLIFMIGSLSQGWADPSTDGRWCWSGRRYRIGHAVSRPGRRVWLARRGPAHPAAPCRTVLGRGDHWARLGCLAPAGLLSVWNSLCRLEFSAVSVQLHDLGHSGNGILQRRTWQPAAAYSVSLAIDHAVLARCTTMGHMALCNRRCGDRLGETS